MNLQEYEKVKDLNYLQYCDYLQNKYGIGKSNYYYNGCNTKNPKCRRTNEGLYIHHKFEDHAIMLSHSEHAKNHPYEWQLAENLIYCDYFEHLLLHILIHEEHFGTELGIGGIVNFIIPELNYLFSGFPTSQPHIINTFNKVKDNKNVYFVLIKRFSKFPYNRKFILDCINSSFNERWGLWSKNRNLPLVKELVNFIYQ